MVSRRSKLSHSHGVRNHSLLCSASKYTTLRSSPHGPLIAMSLPQHMAYLLHEWSARFNPCRSHSICDERFPVSLTDTGHSNCVERHDGCLLHSHREAVGCLGSRGRLLVVGRFHNLGCDPHGYVQQSRHILCCAGMSSRLACASAIDADVQWDRSSTRSDSRASFIL
jgi:hypothetical protein